MATVREVESRMRGFLSKRYADDLERPVEWRVSEWIGFSKNYLGAAVVVEADNCCVSPASLYLAGHGLECALKACMCADGEVPARSHDLVHLMELAEEKGYRLREHMLWRLVRLNWQILSDPETRTKWKARYPLDQHEADAMRPPKAVEALDLGVDLLKQVSRRVDLDLDWDLWRIETLQAKLLRLPDSKAPG